MDFGTEEEPRRVASRISTRSRSSPSIDASRFLCAIYSFAATFIALVMAKEEENPTPNVSDGIAYWEKQPATVDGVLGTTIHLDIV